MSSKTPKLLRLLLVPAALAGLAPAACAGGLETLDLDFMLRGYCLAGSRDDPKAPGGYGSAANSPQKLTDRSLGRAGQLALVALPGNRVSFAAKHRGFKLLLINRTRREVPFAAQDSRLDILQEALDPKGHWKPIEYLPSSWCGNSYHRVFLPSGYFWEFTVPAYTGSFKTKLRFVLQGEKSLYSNEFDGSVNPGQFTEKQGHTPTNIMDPYDE